MSQDFDTVIRNAQVATASDRYLADIGISGGRIVAIGQGLPAGRQTLDAAGRLVTPGGVDAHCHLDQPTSDGSKMADDFVSGTSESLCWLTVAGACLDQSMEIVDYVPAYRSPAGTGCAMGMVRWT